MARNPNRTPKLFRICALIAFAATLSASEASPRNSACLDALKKDRARLLEQFGKLQNYRTYTPAKARALQTKVEKYLVAIGDVLENFNVDDFLSEKLQSISGVKALSKIDRDALTEVLRPAFESRRLPALDALTARLQQAGLEHLPAEKIRDTMDRSFRIWRTKLVFDETGPSLYNQLAKKYSRKLGVSELSLDLGLLGKNEWEAFFESEKGRGIFNPSMPGLLDDLFTSTEAHESVHMVVETLAARGHESPYAVWLKMDRRYHRTGAIGRRQKAALQKATDPLSDGDYYRTELYLDEFPAHVIQMAYLNVALSKTVRERFDAFLASITDSTLRNELEGIYGYHLGGNKIPSRYSAKSRETFDSFLRLKANDGRTKVSKILSELTEYVNFIDLINDSGSAAVSEARKVVEEALTTAQNQGRKSILPQPDGPIAIKADNFLGRKGYRVEVRIPVDILGDDLTFTSAPQAATINFRFSGDRVSDSITLAKQKALFAQMDWVAELGEKSRHEIDAYTDFLDEKDALQEYTFGDVFKLKKIVTRLRGVTRETLERIRANP